MQRVCKWDGGALVFPVATPLTKLPYAWSMLDLNCFLFVDERLEVLVACRKTVLGQKQQHLLLSFPHICPMFCHNFVCKWALPLRWGSNVHSYHLLGTPCLVLWSQLMVNQAARFKIQNICGASKSWQIHHTCHLSIEVSCCFMSFVWNNWYDVTDITPTSKITRIINVTCQLGSGTKRSGQVNSPFSKATKDLRIKNHTQPAFFVP